MSESINAQILEPGSGNHVYDAEFQNVGQVPGKRKKKLALLAIVGVAAISLLLLAPIGGDTSKPNSDLGASPEEKLLLDAANNPPVAATESTNEAASLGVPPSIHAMDPKVQDVAPDQKQASVSPPEIESPITPTGPTIQAPAPPIPVPKGVAAPDKNQEPQLHDKQIAMLTSKIAKLEANNERLIARIESIEKSSRIQPQNGAYKQAAETASRKEVPAAGVEKEEIRGSLATYGIQVVMTDGIIMKIAGKDLELGPGKAIPGMKGRFVKGIPESKTVVTEKAIYYLK